MKQLVRHVSESVTAGHPDKVCDIIAAAILDAATKASLKIGAKPRVAIEVSAKGDMENSRGTLMLFGEVTLPKGIKLNYKKIARDTIAKIGYTDPDFGFWHGMKDIILRITEQSSEIAKGIEKKRTGAGDQGVMFGGALEGDGPEFMPLPIMIAHALTDRYTQVFKQKTLKYLRPDGKAQVVVGYSNDHPVSVEKVTLAVSHNSHTKKSQINEDIYKELVLPVLNKFKFKLKNFKNQFTCNGAGSWTTFGPLADAGTTGRKIIVDTYGGYFPHGGGSLNGKDWTKVDVAGPVGARYVAKALVANGFASKVQIEVGYTIGLPDPDVININTFGTERYSLSEIKAKAADFLDLSVDGIIDGLNLAQPIYSQAAVGGWFGRSQFPWEKVPHF